MATDMLNKFVLSRKFSMVKQLNSWKNSLYKAQKMGLSESDFAQMAGLVDRQVGGYEEGIDPFEAMQQPPPES